MHDVEDAQQLNCTGESSLHRLLQHQDSFDNPKFQTLLQHNPVPPLQQHQVVGFVNQQLLNSDLADFDSGLLDLDLSTHQQQASKQDFASASGTNSTGKKRAPPSKANRKEVIKKKKKNSNKKPNSAEEDDSRPETDKAVFAQLQEAKKQYRELQQYSQSLQNSSPFQHNMEGTGDASTTPGLTTPESSSPGSPDDAHAHSMETNETTTMPPDVPTIPRKPSGSSALAQNPSPPSDGLSGANRGKKRKVAPVSTLQEPTPSEVQKIEASLSRQAAKDKKIPKDKRLHVINLCRREIYILRHNMEEYKQHCAQLKKDKVQWESEKAQLLEEKNVTKSRSKAQLLRMVREVRQQAQEKAKNELWSKRKFISCPDEEVDAANFVLNLLDLPQHKTDQAAIDSWIETYRKPVKRALFVQRNYVTSELKKIAWHCFENNLELPKTDVILKCATRAIVSDADMKDFKWYWEVVLPKMVGASEWGKNVRYYNTISRAIAQDSSPRRKLISVSDEAMIVIIWDNCYDRWHKLWTWSLKTENKGKNQPNWNGKYTVTDQGQSEWGGWLPDGLQAYNQTCKKIKAARKDPKTKQLEKTCLQQLRAQFNITCENEEAQKKLDKARKRREKKGLPTDTVANAPAMQKIVRTCMDDDSDEEEENVAVIW